MQRVYYIVSWVGDDGWAVGVEDEPPVKFSDLQKAVDAAADAARDLWERYGLPSGVQVAEPDGSVRESHSYGD